MVIISASGTIFFLFLNKEKTEIEEYEQKKDIETNNQKEGIEINKGVLILDKFKGVEPQEWGEKVSGVYNKLDTNEKKIALTLDACANDYDEDLINYLIKEDIPAAIFASGRWLKLFPDTAKELSEKDLFTIENHGWEHKPCSVDGKGAYGAEGTGSLEEVLEEILKNNARIEEITGRRPEFYRSGTAHYDEVCVSIANELGLEVAGFDIAADAGATFNKAQIEKEMSRANEGSIILIHINRPDSEIAEGVKMGIELLKERGYDFVKLSEYSLAI